jgi:hypothetical protein
LTSKNSTEPKLDSNGLQNNGGPTQTVALQPTSPAVNAIPPSINGCGTTITTDQRGVNRPQGPACDIGAFKLTKASRPDKDKKKHHKKKHHKKHKGGGGGISQG